MSYYRLENRDGFNKKLTVDRFEVQLSQKKYTKFTEDLIDILPSVIDKPLFLSKNLNLMVRKFHIGQCQDTSGHNKNFVFCFVSFFEPQHEVSYSKISDNPSEEVTEEEIFTQGVDNADTVHSFFIACDDVVYYSQTLLYVSRRAKFTQIIESILKQKSKSVDNLKVLDSLNKDLLATLKNDKIKEVRLDGDFSLLSLGFEQTDALTRMFNVLNSEEETNDVKAYGKLILSGNQPLIKSIQEDSPETFIDNLGPDFIIYTENNGTIKSQDLCYRGTYFLKAVGKTKTVLPSAACKALENEIRSN